MAIDEDVLRADIAMHQRDGLRLRVAHQGLQLRRQVDMAFGRGQQIGLQPDVEEDRLAVEVRRQRGARRRMRMDAHQRAPHGTGSLDLCVAIAQLLLPQRMARQVVHGQHAQARMLAQHARRGARHGLGGHLHPAGLVAVAFDRRPPVGRHAQLGQGALGADRALRGVDAPDVGRHAAGQRLTRQRFGPGQAQLAQRLGKGFGHLLIHASA